ncbi:HEAT repeat domain-containing protein [Candidatus Woesearchaeota archaeon]|nr:HEAT repeat domain-containing protein [Candidatus Woesearchaeota archaeon]
MNQINPAWHGTLEFLAGMLDETEFLGLFGELNLIIPTQEKFNKREDSSKEWNNHYLDAMCLTARCLTENSTILFYGKYGCVDDFIDDCQEIPGELEGKSIAKIIALILNSNLNLKEKTERVDEISDRFYWFDWEFKLHDQIPFRKGQFNDKGVESIIWMIQKSFEKGSKKKYSPKFIYDLSQGINRTEKVIGLLEKSSFSSTSDEEEFYFALLLGESLNPKYWIKFLEKLSFDSGAIHEGEMRDCIQKNLIKKRKESVEPLIHALTAGSYSSCQIADTLTESDNGIYWLSPKVKGSRGEITNLLIDLFRSNTPGKYDSALNKIKNLKYYDSLWVPIITSLRAAYHRKDCIVEILEKIGQPAVKPLVELLNSNHPERFYAAKALGDIMGYDREKADPDALNSLINYLSSEEPHCYYAAIALGEIRSSTAMESLINFLHSSHSGGGCAIPAFGKIGDTRAVDPLIEYIQRENDELNISAAVNALSMINSTEAREYLTCFVKQNPKYLSNLEGRINRLDDIDKLSWIDELKEEIRAGRKEEELDIPF